MTGKIPISRIRIFRVDERAFAIAGKTGVTPLTALLLVMRGISGDSIDEARTWLRPGLSDSLDSVSMGEGARDAALLWKEMKGARRVVIYGDYDVDGASATALALEMALESFHEVRYFIPHRHKEGYGVHEKVVRALAGNGCDLLVTVDCGTRDISALRAARDAGIPVIVFDHHAPGEDLPEGAIVVNPHFDGDDEARTLCAAGVLWVWAMKEGIMPLKWLEERLDLAALATLADHVPLGRLNRALVRKGMDVIRHSRRRGLRRLLDETGVQSACVDEETIVMKIIPCLNAAGRLGLADISVDVLLGGEGLEKNVRELVGLNRKRQLLSAGILEEVLPKVARGESLVLSDLSWPVGVLSGVASRVCSETGLPVALASVSGDHVRGTLRVPPGADAMDVLETVSPGLISWGGHRFAAGFSVSNDNWVDVAREMEKALFSIKTMPENVMAIEMLPNELGEEEIRAMADLGPFGSANPCPLFFYRSRGGVSLKPLGRDGKHLRVATKDGEFLAFGGGSFPECIKDSLGWTFRPRINTWRGKSRVDMIMESVVFDDGGTEEGCGH